MGRSFGFPRNLVADLGLRAALGVLVWALATAGAGLGVAGVGWLVGGVGDPVGASIESCTNTDSAAVEQLRSPHPDPLTIAQTAHGTAITASRFGSSGPLVVWVGGIHGDEAQGAELTAALRSNPPAAVASGSVSLVIVDDLNPDGRAAGERNNSAGVDLNRNFPAASFEPGDTHGPEPLSEPESCALYRVLTALKPELTMVAHAHSELKAINFDGPARAFADAFAAAAADRSFAVLGNAPDLDPYPTPTPGSLGQWWGVDQSAPLLTVEWSKAESAAQAASSARASVDAVFGAVAATAPSATSPATSAQSVTTESTAATSTVTKPTVAKATSTKPTTAKPTTSKPTTTRPASTERATTAAVDESAAVAERSRRSDESSTDSSGTSTSTLVGLGLVGAGLIAGIVGAVLWFRRPRSGAQ